MRQGRSNRARMDPPRPSPGPNTWRRHFSSVPHHIAVSDIITLSCTLYTQHPIMYTQRFPLLLYRAFRFRQNMNSSAVRLWLVAHTWRPKAVHWQHSALKRLFPSSCRWVSDDFMGNRQRLPRIASLLSCSPMFLCSRLFSFCEIVIVWWRYQKLKSPPTR